MVFETSMAFGRGAKVRPKRPLAATVEGLEPSTAAPSLPGQGHEFFVLFASCVTDN